MGKQRNKKKARQQQQHGMDVEAPQGGAAAADDGGWQTGPVGDDAADFLGMDTGEGAAVQAAQQRGERPVPVKRGARSSKQKARKRKSLEKALAVASRAETKVVRLGAKSSTKKSLKKLWSNE